MLPNLPKSIWWLNICCHVFAVDGSSSIFNPSKSSIKKQINPNFAISSIFQIPNCENFLCFSLTQSKGNCRNPTLSAENSSQIFIWGFPNGNKELSNSITPIRISGKLGVEQLISMLLLNQGYGSKIEYMFYLWKKVAVMEEDLHPLN